MLNINAIDFETTNVDPKIAHPVEVALYNPAVRLAQSLIKPPCPIPVETSAIHHITDLDVLASPNWEAVRIWIRDTVTSQGPAILIAHNARYEMDIVKDLFDGHDVSWICTYKCALRIWPDAPNHKNETLRYWLGLQFLGRGWDQQAHSAGHDATVTYHIYLKLLEHTTTEQMIAWSKEPAALPRIPFGKHKGSAWSDVPYDYLAWMVKQTDMEVDVKFCANKEIARRRTNATVRSS